MLSTLGIDCREWPEGATNAKILTHVQEHSRPGTVVVFTDGSVRRGSVGWANSSRENEVVVADAVVHFLRLPRVCVWR